MQRRSFNMKSKDNKLKCIKIKIKIIIVKDWGSETRELIRTGSRLTLSRKISSTFEKNVKQTAAAQANLFTCSLSLIEFSIFAVTCAKNM